MGPPWWFWLLVAVTSAGVGILASGRPVRAKAMLAGSLAATLLFAVAALFWLTFAAVRWVVDQPDWVTEVGALAPLATALAAVVAFTIGLATVAQKWRADRRDQWWKRAQWALEAATNAATGPTDVARRRVGQQAITYLGRSSGLRARDDILFLATAYPADAVPDVTQRLVEARRQEGMPNADVEVELVDDDGTSEETGNDARPRHPGGGIHGDTDPAAGS